MPKIDSGALGLCSPRTHCLITVAFVMIIVFDDDSRIFLFCQNIKGHLIVPQLFTSVLHKIRVWEIVL